MYDSIFQRIKMADFPIECRAAYAFAKYKHKQTGAIRKGSGLPYFVHPKGVAMIILENGGTIEQINAGLLHDTIEDTDTSSLELKTLFGEKVANMVWELTNSKIEIQKIGKEEYMSKKLINLSEDALTVKLADFIYNMNDQPVEKTLERMYKNIYDLILGRPNLSEINKKLAYQAFSS